MPRFAVKNGPTSCFHARNPLKNPILGIFRQLFDHKSIMNDIILFARCQEKILKYIAFFQVFLYDIEKCPRDCICRAKRHTNNAVTSA
jgi:hypothetical protein